MRLPEAPRALATALPDVPRYVETRALLLSGDALLFSSDKRNAGVVMDTTSPTGAVVGRADTLLLREVLAGAAPDFELFVQMDALPEARQALPGWNVRQVVVHVLTRPYHAAERADPGVVVSAPPKREWLAGFPEDVQASAGLAQAIAVRVVEGSAVAVCAAGDVTETLWDVGIDTLQGHRRRGFAAACFQTLAAWMAAGGTQPVWSAYEDYPPSLALAAKLGFEPVDRIAVLSPDK